MLLSRLRSAHASSRSGAGLRNASDTGVSIGCSRQAAGSSLGSSPASSAAIAAIALNPPAETIEKLGSGSPQPLRG